MKKILKFVERFLSKSFRRSAFDENDLDKADKTPSEHLTEHDFYAVVLSSPPPKVLLAKDFPKSLEKILKFPISQRALNQMFECDIVYPLPYT